MGEFLKFILTSGFAAIVNVVMRVILSMFVDYEIALVISYLIAMITAYVLARKFVFEASGKQVHSELVGFTIINIIALVQVWCVSVVLYRWFFPKIGWDFEPALLAHLIGVASPAFTSYFGHKYLSFRKAK